MSEHSYFDHLHSFKTGALKLADLRSPCEFFDGAMPFAENIALFSDAERAEVGTLYKNAGPTPATQLGLEMVAAKITTLVDSLAGMANAKGEIAIHCWRGGNRSAAVATLLRVIGLKPILLTGGYKRYRNEVLQRIEQLASHDLLILNGRTGCGKTLMLKHLRDEGLACLDFENLAAHRGSALGDFNLRRPQPTQQNFENAVANEYEGLKHSKVILAEIEQDLGSIRMPHNLRRKIYSSPMILLRRELNDRVSHLVAEYTENWSADDDQKFLEKMLLLKPHIQGPAYQRIIDSVLRRTFHEAVALLLENRYDRSYDKGIKRMENNFIATINISDGWDIAKRELIKIIQTRLACAAPV